MDSGEFVLKFCEFRHSSDSDNFQEIELGEKKNGITKMS
jgi:hypothetical protein